MRQKDETSNFPSQQHFLLFVFKAHPILLQSGQWLVDAVDKLVDMFKVLGHLCCENHINDSLSECSIFVPGGGREGQR